MVSHSLIVSVLLAFSVAVQAGAVSRDEKPVEINPAIVSADISAVLHKDVGLQQQGDASEDVMEALDGATGCAGDNCEPAAPVPSAQTLGDLLDLNRESSGFGPLIALLTIVVATGIYASRRSPFTK